MEYLRILPYSRLLRLFGRAFTHIPSPHNLHVPWVILGLIFDLKKQTLYTRIYTKLSLRSIIDWHILVILRTIIRQLSSSTA